MARFHTSANDRSWHTANRRTVNSLKRHKALMDEFIRAGMSKEEASKRAFNIVAGKVSQ